MSETITHVPEGFQVYGESTIGYLDAEDNIHINVETHAIMLNLDASSATTEEIEGKLDVIASSPVGVPGTIAFMPGWTDAWQMQADKEWKKFISST